MIKLLGTTATITAVGAFTINGPLEIIAATITILLGISTLIGIIYGVRYKTAYESERAACAAQQQAIDAWREGREAQAARADRLHNELIAAQKHEADALKLLADAKGVIQNLEQLPNLERVIDLMNHTFEKIDERAVVRLERGIDAMRTMHMDAEREHERRFAAILARLPQGGSA